ncbi:lipid-A-disaccharide synthase [Roseomonas alkaliterrae]|uniref:Lipid-A-disaccharide synthase n=1 Tax=Neoroseomonas alkaliterrae TaxID=1452450 RepID=A0A840YAD9_9PROT|nr:lipid-A-disaccharide synthase [Neoroseomonas alkaliterrae]MBB5690963.1 lipid-A-disaccharide synthase [Neoroseomonas alkaliterrae]MBR0674663.1 lipid-A-disaccharide synthase [Neoroseomonas alkaliterrae]
MTLVYVVAGEASGDVLGARLVAALRRRRPDLEFRGIGGPRMAEQGVTSLFDYRELALMGLLEVLPRIFRLKRLLADAAADVARQRPAVLVTIDSPGFTLRLAELVRPFGQRIVHYVAPQVWAWRPGRVVKLRRKVDRILCLLPFEPVFFEQAGIPVTFVGHPVLESGADRGDAARFRAGHGLGEAERPVIVMPGSRRMEASRLLPVFGEALRIAGERLPGLRPVVPVAPIVAEAVRGAAPGWPAAPILVEGNDAKHDAFAAVAQSGGAGLIKSGTSSLEMAVAGIPHVVAYKVNALTAAIVRRLVKVPHASLVNLLAEREVVPERLQENCTPEALAEALLRPMLDPAVAAAQRAGMAESLAKLRAPEGLPSEAAAEAVLREMR